MTGRRLADCTWPDVLPDEYRPGDFWRVRLHPGGNGWYVCAPGGHIGHIGKHKVIEHDDGLISVPRPGEGEPANSIAISTTRDGQNVELFHGYIEHGVWEPV